MLNEIQREAIANADANLNNACLPLYSELLTITVRVTSVYGNRTIYPVCDGAKFFARLLGTKTLTQRTIDLLKDHGYTIRLQPNATEI